MYSKIKQSLQQFIHDESGPTAVEYALMLALIAGFLLATILSFGTFQKNLWIDMSNDIQNATN